MMIRRPEGFGAILANSKATTKGEWLKEVEGCIERLNEEARDLARKGRAQQLQATLNLLEGWKTELQRGKLRVTIDFVLDQAMPPQQVPLNYWIGVRGYAWTTKPNEVLEFPRGQQPSALLLALRELAVFTGNAVECHMGIGMMHGHIHFHLNEDIEHRGKFMTKLSKMFQSWVN